MARHILRPCYTAPVPPDLSEPVVIVPYDPSWPARFEALRAELVAALPGLFVEVEHFGSTSVPDLAAKPVIDLLAAVRTLADAERAAPVLASLGYAYVPEYNEAMPERRYFRRPHRGPHEAHLHVYEAAEFRARPERRFRDHLRSHPEEAAAYGALKCALVEQHRNDRAAYTAAKSTFILAVTARS